MKTQSLDIQDFWAETSVDIAEIGPSIQKPYEWDLYEEDLNDDWPQEETFDDEDFFDDDFVEETPSCDSCFDVGCYDCSYQAEIDFEAGWDSI